MSEKLSNTNIQKESPKSPEQFDFDEAASYYGELNNTRIDYESDGKHLYGAMKSIYKDAHDSSNPIESDKYEKLKTYFELDEKLIAQVEYDMAEVERTTGYHSDSSRRFDNCENDVMICSSLFFYDRVEEIRAATGDKDIDMPLSEAINGYLKALDHDNDSLIYTIFEDTRSRQEYISNCQKRRSISHNEMITKINQLNDTAKKLNLTPLTYRNLATNSSVNNFQNTQQMQHDRLTAARYVSEVLELGEYRHVIKSSAIDEI